MPEVFQYQFSESTQDVTPALFPFFLNMYLFWLLAYLKDLCTADTKLPQIRNLKSKILLLSIKISILNNPICHKLTELKIIKIPLVQIFFIKNENAYLRVLTAAIYNLQQKKCTKPSYIIGIYTSDMTPSVCKVDKIFFYRAHSQLTQLIS